MPIGVMWKQTHFHCKDLPGEPMNLELLFGSHHPFVYFQENYIRIKYPTVDLKEPKLITYTREELLRFRFLPMSLLKPVIRFKPIVKNQVARIGRSATKPPPRVNWDCPVVHFHPRPYQPPASPEYELEPSRDYFYPHRPHFSF